MFKTKEHSTPNQDLEQATLSWIATFNDLTNRPENFESLCDGVVLTEIMNRIDPKIFDMSKVNPEISDNWALRLTNLSNLCEGLETYYTSVLNTPWDKEYIDTFKVSKNEEKVNLYNLVGLVIVATVQSAKKEHYINAILSLDDSCQTALMDLIERVLQKCNPDQFADSDPSGPSENPVLTRGSTLYSVTFMTKFEMQEKRLLAKVEELENENQSLQTKLTDMSQEKENLKLRISDLTHECHKKTEEVRKMVEENEKMQEKLHSQESIDELKKQMKLKDHKYEQLEQFIEELKEKHHGETMKFENEIEKQKNKVAELSKLEGQIDFYKQKYEECGNLNRKITEMEEEIQRHKNRTEEVIKSNEALQGKITSLKEKLEAEQTKHISLDIELTKKQAEIEAFKSEKKRLENANTILEAKINEQSRTFEKTLKEHEDSMLQYGNPDQTLSQFIGQEFLEEIGESEKENIEPKLDKKDNMILLADVEKEGLNQEIETLRSKCKEMQMENDIIKNQYKETQIENQILKMREEENLRVIEKINKENGLLMEEVERALKVAQSPRPVPVDTKPFEFEIENLKKQLKEAQNMIKKKQDDEQVVMVLKNEITEKTKIIGQLSQQIVEMKASSLNDLKTSQKIRSLEEQIEAKDEEIRELSDEVESMKGILAEVGDQKEEELKVLAFAMQELSLRNMQLQQQLGKVQGLASGSKGYNNGDIGQDYRQRK